MGCSVGQRREAFVARATAKCAAASETSETQCLRLFSAHKKEQCVTEDRHAVAQIRRINTKFLDEKSFTALTYRVKINQLSIVTQKKTEAPPAQFNELPRIDGDYELILIGARSKIPRFRDWASSTTLARSLRIPTRPII